jgi:hypothetical protein
LRVNEPTFTNDEGQLVVPVVPTTLAVYRNLRIGLGMTAMMLATAMVIQSTYVERPTGGNCWQGALSEYFYTSAHSIFVAGLLGLATLFFVYRGSSDTENALLTLAGVAALTAALVPQGKSYINLCTPLFIPDDVEVATVIRPNLVAIVAALALAWVITWFQRHYDRRDENGNKIRQQKSPGGNWARWVLRLVVVVGLIALCTPKVDSRDFAHGAAGFLLLSSFIATVFATAFVASREQCSPRGDTVHRIFRCFYWVWAVVMLVTFLGIIAVQCVWPKFFGDLWGTYVEGAVLVEFCVYWAVQTFDLWDNPDRKYRLSTADRRRLAQTYEPGQGEAADNSSGAKVMSFL